MSRIPQTDPAPPDRCANASAYADYLAALQTRYTVDRLLQGAGHYRELQDPYYDALASQFSAPSHQSDPEPEQDDIDTIPEIHIEVTPC